MTRPPFISVIIPHYNQPQDLRRCLESLEAQTLPSSDYEIIVGDNGGEDEDALDRVRRDFPTVRFIRVQERGAAPARNGAMAVARPNQKNDLFAFIDADCLAAPDWLSQSREEIERQGVDMMGGEVSIFCRSHPPTAVEAFEKLFGFRQKMYVEKRRFSVTANLLVTKRAATAIGGFRNNVSEDVDYCHRGQALGFCLAFYRKSIVHHPARASWSALTIKWRRLIQERWHGTYKGRACVDKEMVDRGEILRSIKWSLAAIATGLSGFAHLGLVFTSPKLCGARERLGAAWILIRIRIWRCFEMVRIMMKKKDWAHELKPRPNQ